MNILTLLERIQGSALAEWMRYTNGAMPIVEALHVAAAVAVFGTVLIVDLRLLGLVDASRPYERLSRETLPLTWLAFAVAAVTGVLMFTTSAEVYFANTAFRWKTLALLGAGLNMALFQLVTARGAAAWNGNEPPPRAARAAGLSSLLLWAAVVLLGRWIGFTKGYDFTIPADLDLSFPD
jgi:hypothetical protein